jgi:hypothetical protein
VRGSGGWRWIGWFRGSLDAPAFGEHFGTKYAWGWDRNKSEKWQFVRSECFFCFFWADAEGVANRWVAVAGGGGMCCNQARWMRVVLGSVLVLNMHGVGIETSLKSGNM